MSGPVRPPLTTKLDNDSSENRPVNTIAFANTDFTLTNSGTKTTIGLSGAGGGTIGGTIAATQVAFGSAADTIAGSANFTFVDETGGNGPTLQLTGDKPVLKLQDDTDTTTYRTEFLQSGASQYINSKDSTGTNNEMFRIDPTYIAMQRSMTANVGIGTVPDSGVSLHIIGTSQDVSTPLVRFQTNNDDSDTAPIIEFYRNSTSIEAGNQLGMIRFSGNNTSGDKETYGSINVQIDSGAVADSTSMQFKVKRSGTEVDNFRIRYSEVVVNEDSTDCDFRVETNGNAYGLHVDAANDTVGIGGVGASDVALHVFDDGGQDVLLRLETDENSADKSPALEFYKNSAADISDYIMAIDSYGLDDGAAKSHYSRIATYIEDETAATENAVILFQVAEAGSLRSNLVVGSTLVTINANQRNIDFRVLADDGSKNIYSDAGINAVGIQEQPTTGLADNNPALQVEGSISSKCAIVTKTSATVDLSTRDSNELIGQLYVLTSASAKTFTVPTSCTQGDWFRVLTTGANGMDIVSTGGATLNGATPASLNRDAQNEIYTVVAIATDKWVCTSN